MNKAEYYSKLPDEVPAIPLNPPPVIPPHRNGDLRHSIEHGNWEEPELPDPGTAESIGKYYQWVFFWGGGEVGVPFRSLVNSFDLLPWITYLSPHK